MCKYESQLAPTPSNAENSPDTVQKKPYQEGYILFTVPVNQTMADNLTAPDVSSEGTEELVDVECILRLPPSYTPTGRPCKLLMICHGAGRGAVEWTQQEGYRAIVQKFIDENYAVFDCNGLRNDYLGWTFWGQQRGLSAWRKAYQYVVNNYNVQQTFSIYGFSMGGLTAMNLAFQNMPNINSIALGSPVLELKSFVWDNPCVRDDLKALCNMDQWDDRKVAGCNPYRNIVTINGKNYCFKCLPPLKIWYGGTESAKQYAINLAEAIVNAGGYAEYREVSGAGHEICYGMNDACNTDYLLFTQRYNGE